MTSGFENKHLTFNDKKKTIKRFVYKYRPKADLSKTWNDTADMFNNIKNKGTWLIYVYNYGVPQYLYVQFTYSGGNIELI